MALSIKEINEILKNTPKKDLKNTLLEFSEDKRAGVKNLIIKYEKKLEKHYAEIERVKKMCVFENEKYEKGYEYIAGIDEVGRGPLAGPVVTCAIILKKGFLPEGINDSKKLSPEKRESLYNIILENAISYSIGIISPLEIDEINILQATYKAMRNAINSLSVKPSFILADAVTIPEIEIPQQGIIKGDQKSISIAAASIIAKVTRDNLMKEYAKVYEGYGFEKNMGYGTEEHIKALKEIGPCPIHRKTFIKNFI